mmetsp:Transcript_8750/g.27550  ORF Transcript_8750/g.27550 Transcript_8750/m.27550 type:complete len:191 (+) Transcript_8750:45-617(+)
MSRTSTLLLAALCSADALSIGSAPTITSRAAVAMGDKPANIPTKMKWVPFVSASETQKGTAVAGFQYGLEIAVVTDTTGKQYAIANKLPPFGQPATFGTIGAGTITDPVTLSTWDLKTGKPIGAWCPAPPLIGPIIFNALSSPSPLTVFPCRKSGNNIEANVNVNAKAQFESGYWRGILDAQGKTDGGYY